MKYSKNTLPNGLRVITVPMPAVPSVTLTVWVKTGSRFEDKKVNGISHFLEHMVFKGSKKRPTAREISGAVDAIGGEFNAGTSKEWTNFYIKAASRHLETAFDVLSDMVLNPLLKAEEIEKEKGVIVEELAMYEDTPMIKIGDVFEELIFSGNPLSWDIGGTADRVRGIKGDDFVRYRESHYYPENMLITVAGGVTEKQVMDLTKKYFGPLSKSKKGSKFTKFGEKQNAPQFKFHSKKKEQTHLILGFRGNRRGHKERYAEAILATIMGASMSSRMFIEVRERRGLAYAIRTNIEHYMDTGYIGTYAGVDTKRAEEAVKVILDQHYGLADGHLPISDEEMKKAKEFLKGHLALSLEDTKDVDSYFGEQELLLGKIEEPEYVTKKIDSVTKEEVTAIAKKFFKPQNLNLALIGPYKDAGSFGKIIK